MSEKPTAIGVAFGKAWPGLRYLSLGVWTAWLFLISSGSIWLSDTEFDGTYVAYLMLGMSVIGALVCLAAPLLRIRFEALLAKRTVVLGVSFLGSIGAVAIIVAGPFYLGTQVLFWAGIVLVSLFSGFFVLKCGSLYGTLDPKRVLLFSLYCEIVVVAVSYFVIGNDFFVPVSGGPSLSGILAFALLPPLAAWLSCLPASKEDKPADRSKEASANDLPLEPETSLTAATSATAEEPTEEESASPSSLRTWLDAPKLNILELPKVFWKFLFMIFFFTLASETFRYFFVFVRMPTITYIDARLVLLLRAAFATIVLIYAFRTSGQLRFSKMYQFSLVALAVAVALIPLLQDHSTVLGSLIGLISVCMNLLIWCLLSMVVYEKNMPFIIVFGFGQGVLLLARACGWMVGIGVLPALSGTVWEPFCYWGVAVLILVMTVLFFSEMHLDRMFDNIALGKITLDLPVKDAGPEKERRPWREACLRIAKRSMLSQREEEIFELIATGRSPKNIAKHLVVSINTVRSHIRNIYVKLDAHSHEELIDLIEQEIQSMK